MPVLPKNPLVREKSDYYLPHKPLADQLHLTAPLNTNSYARVKLVFGMLGMVLLITGVTIGVYLSQQSHDVRSRASEHEQSLPTVGE